MKFREPIPILETWRDSRAGAFVKRHIWFFAGSGSARYMSPYQALFIYLPAGMACLYLNFLVATIVVGLSLGHLFLSVILILSANEKSPNANLLTGAEKQKIIASLKGKS